MTLPVFGRLPLSAALGLLIVAATVVLFVFGPMLAPFGQEEVLGTPLVVSVFHSDRWDYVFTLRRQGVDPQSRRLSVYFKGDVLDRFEGDEMPSEAEFVAQLDSRTKSKKIPPLEATNEQLSKFPVPKRSVSASSQGDEAPLPATYPPLEPTRR